LQNDELRNPYALKALVHHQRNVLGFFPLMGSGKDSFVSELTVILQRIDHGDPHAANELLPLVYEELRKLAAQKMARENPGQTLQATALVHEAWLRLGGDAQPAWDNRGHFFAAAAEAMRRILIDNARRKLTLRHGGGAQRVNLEALELAMNLDDDQLLALGDALEQFATHDARKAELVKLRFFVGLTNEQAAQVLGVSEPTVKRDWAYARAWLFREMTA
jgi:RNA polymerase sigma factor (TIGR02999 family)